MMWPKVSSWVATLSLMKRALLANVVFVELSSLSVTMPRSSWLSSPDEVRKLMISPGLCPSNL